MAKYQVTVNLTAEFTFDTADYEDEFAKTKDDLPDMPDPNDEDAVYDFVRDLLDNEGISDFDPNPLITELSVQPKK
jgi:hypothetical protein